MKPIIETRSLGKKFSLVKKERYLALRDAVAGSFRSFFSEGKNPATDFWALKDITISIGQGERVGIIGRNGAGKSTLLKILSRITPPSAGSATIRGRMASLLEVGTGFHPELTGRENIYFNGSVLGLKRSEIRRQFDAIVEFSGVSSFLDMPLKNYSSGMELRLAFAVAAHLEPEVLLIDEVLAVGDVEFQKKCLEKMDEVSKSNGKTILFVSHNLDAIKKLCSSAMLLEKGTLSATGNAADMVNQYVQQSLTSVSPAYHYAVSGKNAAPVFFRTIFSSGITGNPANSFRLDDTIFINIAIENNAQYRSFTVGIGINDMGERRIITDDYEVTCIPGQTAIDLQLSLPAALLTPGTFMVDFSIEKKGTEMIELIKSAIRFEIIKSGTKYESLNYDYGVINTAFNWTAKKNTPIP